MDEFPEVLASADILVAVLESEAGVYSVPPKVLSYLCAGRPIVLAAPPENLAAQIITSIGAGIVVPSDNAPAFVSAIAYFLDDTAAAEAAGCAGRKYADNIFNVPHIANRFEQIIIRSINAYGA